MAVVAQCTGAQASAPTFLRGKALLVGAKRAWHWGFRVRRFVIIETPSRSRGWHLRVGGVFDG